MNRHFPHSVKKNRGLSLIELMVAMILTLILVSGVITIFISNKATYLTQDGLSRVQESGRFGLTFLSESIRWAGYSGCGNLDSTNVHIQADPPPAGGFSLAGALVGYEGGAGWTNPTTITHVAGTDVFNIKGLDPGSLTLVGNMATDNANIQVGSNPDNYQAGDILMITDCQDADVFCAGTVSQSGGTVTIPHPSSCNLTPMLSKAYQDDAMVARFMDITFFIGVNPSGNPSLYRVANGVTQELVEGIRDMQITYGVDTIDDDDWVVDDYRPANTVADWAQVRSVRLGLIAESNDNAYPENISVTLSMPSGNVTYNDQRMRQAFNTTIALRNRLH